LGYLRKIIYIIKFGLPYFTLFITVFANPETIISETAANFKRICAYF